MIRTSSDDGYVTLAVLVVTGLLAVIVTSLLMVSRPALGLARIGFDEVVADGLLDGGLHTAGYLLFPAERDLAAVDGAILRLRSGSVRLAVIDEGGRIDLNASDRDLLAGLYSAVGGSALTPSSFAARIVDWRDADSDRTEGGAEAGNYEDAGIGNLPANAPFRSVEELRMLLGLSGEEFSRLEPFITVFNAGGGVDPLNAPRTVLLAVPGLGRGDVERLLGARDRVRDRDALLGMLSAPNTFLQSQASGVYRVRVQAELANGFASAVEAVLVAPPEGIADYGVVAWSRLAPAAGPR